MLLKLTKSVFLCLSLTCSIASAEQITALDLGEYTLVQGPRELCPDMTAENEGGMVSFGHFYNYHSAVTEKNSHSEMISDIDSNCKFIEDNKRQDQGANLTTLTRQNQEVCNIINKKTKKLEEHVRSKTLSMATIVPTQITIVHQIDEAPPYTCIWKLNE